MKITQKDFNYMKKEILAVSGKDVWNKHYKPFGLSEKCYRWDCMYRAGLSKWVCDNLYPTGIDDTHIDTALRKICSEDYSNV